MWRTENIYICLCVSLFQLINAIQFTHAPNVFHVIKNAPTSQNTYGWRVPGLNSNRVGPRRVLDCASRRILRWHWSAPGHLRRFVHPLERA